MQALHACLLAQRTQTAQALAAKGVAGRCAWPPHSTWTSVSIFSAQTVWCLHVQVSHSRRYYRVLYMVEALLCRSQRHSVLSCLGAHQQPGAVRVCTCVNGCGVDKQAVQR